jgi:lipopolysaccharide transport system permease protein
MRLAEELWASRGFIFSNVRREFQVKYANSLLGFAWNVINPLAIIVVYTVIFAQVMRAKLPGVDNPFAYGIFLCSGILVWGLFAEITSRSLNMFVENANLLKKLRFPRACLPTVVLLNALLNFSIIFVIFTAFLLVSGNFPGASYLSLFPLILLLVVFSVGLGLILGVLNVFFRDVGHAFAVINTFWFWLTPIVYAPNILPEWTLSLMVFNPLAAFFGAVQDVLVRGLWPAWDKLYYMGISGVALCVLGLRLFSRYSSEMVDEL